ncbi:S9 family peptidase [Amycolatopsis sp. H20-H5]|uniref:S9 family peptidase n=1 Tax=Amycolatopsis sp. H20-H5 TaxID=3046309 RepID=UPI002DBDEE40|nr:prolyl oligopeptidase family serine peptidase [Amycolatopsis sp. H20-H5]MEC3980288.1 prolyl oligopeptidase family serine peptidase [Amycolatopsis sp. H20-H5]
MIIETGPFADLDTYVALPRVGGLRLSPDGRRLVVEVATLDRTKSRHTTALWEVDPDGHRPARRLTRDARGESGAGFTPAGDLLFVSKRPDAEGRAVPALWLQPSGGGDARVVAAPPGGVHSVVVSATGTVVAGTEMMPSATDGFSDGEVRATRKDAGVTAILHEEYPIRFWDHDLGPDRTRLLVAELPGGQERLDLRDLTGHVGRALGEECTWDLSADGRTVVTGWAVPEPGGSQRYTLVAIDVATGERRTLADDPDHEYTAPRLSPDGTRVAVVVQQRITPQDPGLRWLAVVDLADGTIRDLTRNWDRRPQDPRWTPDGAALVVSADDHGRSPLWRVDTLIGRPTRLTTDDGAYTDARISPDGRWVYALRAAIDGPPAPVRVALDGPSPVEPLRGPAEPLEIPGRLEEVTTTAADGTPVRGWLSLPHNASAETPAPLVVLIHGGPVGSANTWSWRWSPWLLVSQGYAVLQADFALSTGYGIDFIRRGWGEWGAAPYTDLMSITDTAEERPDIDAGRTAAIGGSYGGYLANWIAGHTGRFSAIVTHASIWALEQSIATGDYAHAWSREMTPEQADAFSPHHFADAITTPMLITHGDNDYNVPIGEALRLWWDLSSRSKAENGTSEHKFLHFPDENHFIRSPNHAKVLHSTVRAFLDHHLRGAQWRRPDLLG